MPNKDNAFERGEAFCGHCKYLKREICNRDPAIAYDSFDGCEYECVRKRGEDRTACARAALAEKRLDYIKFWKGEPLPVLEFRDKVEEKKYE